MRHLTAGMAAILIAAAMGGCASGGSTAQKAAAPAQTAAAAETVESAAAEEKENAEVKEQAAEAAAESAETAASAESESTEEAASASAEETEAAEEAAPYRYSPSDGLLSKGSAVDVDKKVELIRDMEIMTDSGEYETEGFQTRNQDGQVLMSTIRTGNPYMDPVMESVGYSSYTIWYYYDNPDVSDEQISEGPNFAYCKINGNGYEYYYWQNQLIRRAGPDYTADNIEVNEFLNQVWQIGRYYRHNTVSDPASEGRVGADGQKTVRQNITVTSIEDITEEADRIILNPLPGNDMAGDKPRLTLIVDADTVFDTYDADGYADREEGDTPLSWYKKQLKMMREDDGYNHTNLMGVFDIDVTGNHIDRFYGAYWWD